VAPERKNAGVANRATLHLVDGHLVGSTALHDLDETTALSGWNLDVVNLTETLEERAELILSDVSRKTTNEESQLVDSPT
jgi:hypothetical protein